MLFWFRNDLRTHDNSALHYFLSSPNTSLNKEAVFFISKKQWRQHHWADIKIDFILKHAKQLVKELDTLGIKLSLIEVDSFDEQVEFLLELCEKHNIKTVFANSEVELNERQRDDLFLNQARIRQIDFKLFETDVIVPKGKVLNQSGTMFKVFTPFKKAWLRYVNKYGFDYFGKVSTQPFVNEPTEHDDNFCLNNAAKWPLAQSFEQDILPIFFREKLAKYGEYRDIPSIKGTSGISPYLAAGLISPRYVLRQLINQNPDLLNSPDSPNFIWLNEIIWREFYRHLLFHEPRLCKHQCFKTKYQHIVWRDDEEKFLRWQQGRTGYPLVDAAMRQLNQTGWMHNRLRMVVASFLTKHLLIDWRKGEKYFMQNLIDGDLASNNGGWQWAASTGCDAQPYFRVFNPIRQSERFDPNGDFIRMYIPELENVPNKEIHFPHSYIKKNNLTVYWPAMVEHKEARLNAIAFYK